MCLQVFHTLDQLIVKSSNDVHSSMGCGWEASGVNLITPSMCVICMHAKDISTGALHRITSKSVAER